MQKVKKSMAGQYSPRFFFFVLLFETYGNFVNNVFFLLSIV